MNIIDLSMAVVYTLIFPGFLFTAVIGLLLTWVDRKVTAVIQSRIGPPWFQPFADIGKLLSKKMILPRGAHTLAFVFAPFLSIIGATMAALIIFQALFFPGRGYVGDLIVLVYLSALPAIALIIGGAASRSPFGAIGASREMSMVLAYEVAFLTGILTIIIKTNSIQFSSILAHQASHGAIAGTLSGLLALVVFLFSLQAKLGFLPFDISEAETELIGGPLAEYSGAGLALFKISRSMMFFFMPVLTVLVFFGPVHATLLSILGFILKLLLVLVVLIVIKITHARLRLDQALSLFWYRVSVIGLAAIILAFFGL